MHGAHARNHTTQQRDARSLAYILFIATTFCGHMATAGEGDVWTVAPPDVSLKDLGRPVDYKFNILGGPSGKSLYSETRVEKQTRTRHFAAVITDSEHINAHARAWNIDISRSNRQTITLAIYQAYQVVELHQVVDTERITAPKRASYYVAGIQTGYSYGVVFWARTKVLKSAMKAGFAVTSGSVETAKEKYRLQHSVSLNGMRPTRKGAIFATTVRDITSSYRRDSKVPVPIRVLYRQIPRQEDALKLGNSRHRSSSVGTYGGKKHTLKCRGNAAITQLALRFGKLVDQVGATCTALNDYDASEQTKRHGGSGGKPGSVRCKSGQYAVGIHGGAAARIDRLGLLCAAPKEWMENGRPMKEPAVGGPGGKAFRKSCPSGFVLTGLTARVGRYSGLLYSGDVVNAISIRCQQLTAQ